MALKHTGLWLTIEGWVDVADIDNDKVFGTKPSHSHPPHPTTKSLPFHPSSLSNSNPLPSAYSTTFPTSLLLHIVCVSHCQNHYLFDSKEILSFLVSFICRFFQQASGSLDIKGDPVVPQTQRTFHEGTLFQPRFRRKKDAWCDMAHSVVYYQAWVRWLLCNDIIPKAIPLSERLAQCPHLAGHINTMKLVELARTHRL